MKPKRLPFRIEIARWDPARGQIASDITQQGGSPLPGANLIYAFKSAGHRDRVLQQLRGCYGSSCAFAVDALAMAEAAS